VSSKVWEVQFAASDRIGGTAINKDGVVYFKDDHGWFYAVKPDGSLGWKKQINVLYTYGNSAPTVAEDGTIYVTNSDSTYWSNNYGTLVSLSPSGDINWEYKTLRNGDYSPAIDSAGNVYFGAEYWDNNLISIKANSPLSSKAQWPKFGGNRYNTGSKR
jgi:outer membrane protein assembly factor BamB